MKSKYDITVFRIVRLGCKQQLCRPALLSTGEDPFQHIPHTTATLSIYTATAPTCQIHHQCVLHSHSFPDPCHCMELIGHCLHTHFRALFHQRGLNTAISLASPCPIVLFSGSLTALQLIHTHHGPTFSKSHPALLKINENTGFYTFLIDT